MSYSTDVNILLYASDKDCRFHDKARAFLESSAAGSEVFCLGWPTIMAYLRISTHPSIFASPQSPQEAAENIERLLSLPQARTIAEVEGFWETYREVTQAVVARGNLVPDAHLAALLKQHGVRTLYTNNAGFRQFPFLRVKNPLA